MRIERATAAGLLLLGLGSASLAAPPPLDRPSPPPCCADGRCYPNSWTFGWYETRWRRWPVECLEPGLGGQQMPTPPEGLLPYEPPSPIDEDRKAPPPTTPPEDQTRGPAPTAAPGGGENRTLPGPTGPIAIPPQGPLRQPGEPPEPSTPRRGLPPYEPQGPTPRSLDGTGSTSDADPPPALPFGPGMISGAPTVRDTIRQPVLPAHQPAESTPVTSEDDPPPSLPEVLAALTP
jgi:hypothetical protein